MTEHTPGLLVRVHYTCGHGHMHTIQPRMLTEIPAVGEQFRVVSTSGTHALVLRARYLRVHRHPDAFDPSLTLWAQSEGVEATGAAATDASDGPGVCCDLVACRGEM